MAFQVELSIPLQHVGNINQMRGKLVELAEKYKCSRHYTNYEIAGKCRARIRNHLIMTLFFPEENSGIISFLIHIKTMSMVHLESVSYDNCIFILLYASKSYLNMMDKYKAKEYISNKSKLSTGPYKYIIQAAK